VNKKYGISDALVYASARVFSNSNDANTFLGDNPQYRVVANAQGVPDTSVTVALNNDEGLEA
jgi:hypothetical protein